MCVYVCIVCICLCISMYPYMHVCVCMYAYLCMEKLNYLGQGYPADNERISFSQNHCFHCHPPD